MQYLDGYNKTVHNSKAVKFGAIGIPIHRDASCSACGVIIIT